MTAIIWANVVLAIPFVIAFAGVPLWITFRHPSTPDHSQARAYLAAKAAAAGVGTAPVSSGERPGRRSMGRAAFGRRSAATPRHERVGAPA